VVKGQTQLSVMFFVPTFSDYFCVFNGESSIPSPLIANFKLIDRTVEKDPKDP
jgi:hypothetical protein